MLHAKGSPMNATEKPAVAAAGTSHAAQAAPADASLARPAAGVDPLKLYKSAEGYRTIMEWYDSVLDEIQTPYESLYVNTRFGRTHLIAAGPADAQPLFLLPGVAGCAALWRRQLPTLGQHFRVYAVDIPGQPGRSDPNPPSFLNSDYVDWLKDVLDDLRIAKAHFGGVSVGAWIAMRMGIEAPERTLKVVMLGPTGISRARLPVGTWLKRAALSRKNPDAMQAEITAKKVSASVTRAPGEAFGTFDRQLARAMSLCTKHYRVDRSLGIYDEASQRLRMLDGLRVLGKFFLAESRRRLRSFSVPGLIVFGEFEVLYDPQSVGRKARDLMGNVRVEVVPQAGHAAIYDRPEIVDPMVIDFLRS
jgi:pimeloyl-ACP methyl ester carboxylesterase